jgi:hypothetical protein
MDLPLHPPQAQIRSTIRMIEKFGTDVMLQKSYRKAKLELLYIVNARA